MKALQTRILKLLPEKPEESMSNADIVAVGKSARELARALNVNIEDIAEGLTKITSLVSYEVGNTRYWFRTEKSDALVTEPGQSWKPKAQSEPSQQASPRGDDTQAPRKEKDALFLEIFSLLKTPMTPAQICIKLNLYYNQVHPILDVLFRSGYAERKKNEEKCLTCGRPMFGKPYVLTELGKDTLERLRK